jgi:hypothetical protein
LFALFHLLKKFSKWLPLFQASAVPVTALLAFIPLCPRHGIMLIFANARLLPPPSQKKEKKSKTDSNITISK